MPERLVLAAATLLLTTLSALAQQNRPPATPLITHDPYFSVWSNTDKLTDSPTRHWTGHPQPLAGLVRIDGKPFRIMGSDPRNIPVMDQTSMQLTPTHTRYTFAASGIELTLTFFTPAFLDDLDLLSRPVTYLTWTAHSTDSTSHELSVLLDASPDIATSYDHQPVTFSRHRTAATEVLSVGTRDQAILNRSGDDLRIDWGYFHIAIPSDEASKSTISTRPAAAFTKDGILPAADDMEGAIPTGRSAPHLAVALPFGSVGPQAVSRHLLVSYTEDYAIQLMHQNLRPWWQRDNMPVADMLDAAERDYPTLEARGVKFDADLTADLTKSAGEHYAWLCTLAYRQSIAAHKLVADGNGEPMLFAKENFSNGDMATVDVLYPSAPIFLFFNPRLLQAQVLPVLEYAANPSHWHFPFAPHDMGQYPLANGQEYGGGEKTEEDQMPVEESGNLIILVDALARTEGNTALAARFWPLLTKWADYLREKGLDPENQLTTDDFAGHVAHNANLSIKAIDAIAAYADLARLLHHESESKQYAAAAKTMAGKWIDMAKEGDHYKLAFNSPNTWSQKYNLVWDKVLDYNLFPKSVRDSEIAYYKTKLNLYGIPLDSRADYTKLDWELWTATLADNKADFDTLVDPLYKWSNETVSRVPMTDWYDTKTGKQVGFQARSVVGGLFIKALSDRPLADKYRAKATTK
ncbi:glutaminase family protein [Granulicella sibirica]|uniref:Glutaminase A n=1 Tax=Granulicella sibirica TaxID=2479048 RepID=A0A4Q0T2E5_9BACT|nr:glutaminase family protein [Granulicella sibirica]RXH57835.1 Glutaminase A [Granulicella sibirica]